LPAGGGERAAPGVRETERRVSLTNNFAEQRLSQKIKKVMKMDGQFASYLLSIFA
jgi:hypothetical protein